MSEVDDMATSLFFEQDQTHYYLPSYRSASIQVEDINFVRVVCYYENVDEIRKDFFFKNKEQAGNFVVKWKYAKVCVI